MASHRTLHRTAKRFRMVKTLNELSWMLKIPASKIMLHSLHPRYKVFTIRKKKGGKRLIEDPEASLKELLRSLNERLQATYYTLRPDAVYGFCVSNNTEEDRNIISNAKRHIGKSWLLNIDFRDFFHCVDAEKIHGIWKKHFPGFDDELLETLSRLTCYRFRLPMGAPTSPVLSNFSALGLDEELMALCRNCGITYTRFADDCSFSSNQEIDHEMIGMIGDVVVNHGFRINGEKKKLYSPEMLKLVTGIVVEESGLNLPEAYLETLSDEIERLYHTKCVESRYQTGMSLKKLNLFEQELQGKLNFAEMVIGDSEQISELNDRFENAQNPPEAFESENWLEIPYNFF